MSDVPASDLFTRRVCLRLDGMDRVTARRNLACDPAGGGVAFDLYYPPAGAGRGPWPAVIIVSGYPEAGAPRPSARPYKEMGWTVSMCELIAVTGLAAIAYTTREPVADFHALFDHICASAASLRIDPVRVAVMAVSGNVPTALTSVMQGARRSPVCAVFGYGCLLDLDGATDAADAARQFGFAYPLAGRTVADVRRDVPLLITRAGRDQFPAMHTSIDRFIRHGLRENLPITVINHAEGPHAFDLFDDSRTSRDIVRQTLHFLRLHLNAERAGAEATS